MRIGIDARLYSPRFGGVGRYVQELIDHLARIDQENEYILFFNEEDYSQYLAPNARFSKRRITAKKGTLQEQTSFVKDLHREQLDMMHFTNFDVPVLYKKPSIVTIHDLSLIKYPGNPGFLQKMQQNMMLKNVMTNARRIITVSQVIKEEAIKLVGAPVDRIRIINKAVSEQFLTESVDKKLLDSLKIRLGIEKPYVLTVSFWHQQSNLINLIKAYNLFRNRYNTDNQLVIVGRPNEQEDAVRQTITELGLGNHVILTGFVDDRDLPLIYKGAHMYIHPALDEGFGMSVLEAMASEVPVACSNAGALAEICGADNAIFFEPQDITNIAEAFHHVFDDEHVAAALKKKGLEQVKKYSWQDTAEKTLALYKEVAQELPAQTSNGGGVVQGVTGMAGSMTKSMAEAAGKVTKSVGETAGKLEEQGKEALGKETKKE